jgi:tetratricopeptide (TPR) repeat protein
MMFHRLEPTVKTIIIPEFSKINSDIANGISYQKVLEDCLFAKKISFNKGNLIEWGHASKGAGECYRRLGLYELANIEYDLAISAFVKENKHSDLAWAKWAKGNLLRQQCNYSIALKILYEAYQLSYDNNDRRCMAYSIAGIAETTRINGYYTLSLA